MKINPAHHHQHLSQSGGIDRRTFLRALGSSPDFSPRGEPGFKVSMVNIRTATPQINRFGTGAERHNLVDPEHIMPRGTAFFHTTGEKSGLAPEIACTATQPTPTLRSRPLLVRRGVFALVER